ncbi:hypothetical protein BU25DRAFT_338933 [Macroventuria anomochaeta]|uniref:Uncharacterized protein n=1 Tax=Macroventuria anomochaeta TaxID=301207 RepID=A0ACB6S3D4_9PLEO|nr:uncharacterized protein BU25DRAFT_338933 [Macroventuria anomochaeta]KAF2628790.1 hypothetical protein BU25DRAFT_338933 [Macroventuria anomochaeta]
MVSYPDSQVGSNVSAERASSLTIRRPPSVASHSSRTSTIRRHRPHRSGGSSYGGSSVGSQNEFPVFTHTGDVEIVISNGRREKRYLLHKLILTQCSGFFDAGTSEEWSGAGEGSVAQNMSAAALARNPAGSRQDRKKWRYELDWGSDDDVPMLVQKRAQPAFSTVFGDGTHPPPARNKPIAPSSNFLRSTTNFSTAQLSTAQLSTSTPTPAPLDPDDNTFRDYDNLFRIFYNHAPSLDTLNIANAYVECKALLQLADMYSAIDVIGPRVDHHLLRFQGRLWKQIAKYPPSYLKLGYMARSKAIFAEAMVHVVGQWPAALPQLRNQVPDAVLDLIEDKFEDMDELKVKVEVKLFRLSLTTSRGERVSPSSNWLDWMAVSLFRQWLAENTTPPPAPILKSPRNGSATPRPDLSANFNTGRVFRLLGAGGPSYLNHDECKRFLRLQHDQYNRENLKRFERRIEEVKNKAKDAVKPLMRNFLELDLREGGLPYLTCTRVDPQDFPWDAV